jgi:hypothetical protein
LPECRKKTQKTQKSTETKNDLLGICYDIKYWKIGFFGVFDDFGAPKVSVSIGNDDFGGLKVLKTRRKGISTLRGMSWPKVMLRPRPVARWNLLAFLSRKKSLFFFWNAHILP